MTDQDPFNTDEKTQHVDDVPDAHTVESPSIAPGYVALATVCEAAQGQITRVKLLGTNTPFEAIASHSYGSEAIGSTVACVAIHGSHQLMIVGPVALPGANNAILYRLLEDYHTNTTKAAERDIFAETQHEGITHAPIAAQADQVIDAQQQLTLQCGASSITLTADGRISIRGKFVTNSASHLCRISGGSVKIN